MINSEYNEFINQELKQRKFLDLLGVSYESHLSFFSGTRTLCLNKRGFDLLECLIIDCQMLHQNGFDEDEIFKNLNKIYEIWFLSDRRPNVREILKLEGMDCRFNTSINFEQLQRLDKNTDMPYWIKKSRTYRNVQDFHIVTFDENFYMMTNLSGGDIWF